MYIKKVIRKKFRWKLIFCWHLESYWRKKAGSGSQSWSESQSWSRDESQWYVSADPDPYQNVTDPQHWFLKGIQLRREERKKNSRSRTRKENKNQKILWYRYGCTQQIHRKEINVLSDKSVINLKFLKIRSMLYIIPKNFFKHNFAHNRLYYVDKVFAFKVKVNHFELYIIF